MRHIFGPVLGIAVLLLPIGCGSSSNNLDSDAGETNGGDDADNKDATTATSDDGAVFTGSTGSGDAGTGCASVNAQPARAPVDVWLVVDTSLEEAQGIFQGYLSGYDVPQNQTYLYAMRSTLMDPDAGLVPGLQNVEAFGFVGYSYGEALPCDQGVCDTPEGGLPDGELPWCPDLLVVPPALGNATTIASLFPTAVRGEEPITYDALRYVYDHMPTQVGAPAQVVLLAFRGASEFLCGNETAPLPADVIDAGPDYALQGMVKESVFFLEKLIVGRGAKVFVLNNDATDPTALQYMQSVAQAGNTGSPPFTPQSVDDLRTTLQQILTSSVSCDITLKGTVATGQECTGHVTVDGVVVACDDPNGWKLKDPSTLEFVGTACTNLQSHPTAQVSANFPCASFTPPK